MVVYHRLSLDERKHAVSATEPEESDLKKRDEQIEVYHLLTIYGLTIFDLFLGV